MNPDAPTYLTASDAAWGYTLVVLVSFVAVAVACLAWSARRRDALPVLMLLSGLIAVGFEPVIDNLGKVWYADDNPLVVYTSMGVPQPAFLLFGYSLFWGGTTYLGSRLVQRGTSPWRVFAVVFVMDLVVEYLGVPVFHVGTYYGSQPFTLLDFPLWWAFVNAASAVVGIGLLLAVEPRLRGWSRVGVLAVAPTAFGATHATCAWPVWVTLHSPVPPWTVWLAGTATIAMAILVTHVVGLLLAPPGVRGSAMAERRPLDEPSRQLA